MFNSLPQTNSISLDIFVVFIAVNPLAEFYFSSQVITIASLISLRTYVKVVFFLGEYNDKNNNNTISVLWLIPVFQILAPRPAASASHVSLLEIQCKNLKLHSRPSESKTL